MTKKHQEEVENTEQIVEPEIVEEVMSEMLKLLS